MTKKPAIAIYLPDNRVKPGTLTVIDSTSGQVLAGPFKCLGKADRTAAEQHGNPECDPKKCFGDTPLGKYQAWLAYESDTESNRHSYGAPDDTGKIPVICLRATAGDALDRDKAAQMKDTPNATAGLMIHWRMDDHGVLFWTHGCVRCLMQDRRAILGSLPSSFMVTIAKLESASASTA